MTEAIQNQTTLRCSTQPSDAELRTWWETLEADDAGRQWFADAFPQTYAHFVETLTSGAERCTLFFNGAQVAGSYWLHDIVDDDAEYGSFAWLRGYVSPAYRGNFTAEAWPVARSIIEEWGYRHIFAASHAANKRAIACLIKNMQFDLVGEYPDLALYGGKPTLCTVCTMRSEDVGLAMREANRRTDSLLVSA